MRVGSALAYGYFGQYLAPILPRLEESLKMEYETNGDRWNCLNKDLKIFPKMVIFLPKQIVYEVGCGRNISALTCMSSILTYKDTNQPVYVEIECDGRKYHLALNIMSLSDGEEIVAFMEVPSTLLTLYKLTVYAEDYSMEQANEELKHFTHTLKCLITKDFMNNDNEYVSYKSKVDILECKFQAKGDMTTMAFKDFKKSVTGALCDVMIDYCTLLVKLVSVEKTAEGEIIPGNSSC